RVNHAVGHEPVRKVLLILGTGAEPELKDAHSGQLELVAQRLDLGCDHAQVLGDQGQVGKSLLQGFEEGDPRRLHPASFRGGLGFTFHLPVSLKTAEMIDAYQVHPFQESAQAIDPPRESLLLVSFPAIERVAPELPRLAVVIWRYPGLDGRTAARVQEKEVRPDPDIRTVVSDEDGDVADQVDAFFGSALAQGLHLGLEDVLDELVVADARAELVSPAG